jgi:hypothetical protein
MKFCYLCGKIRQIFDEGKLEKRPTQKTKPSPNSPHPQNQPYYGNKCKWGLMEWNIPFSFSF